MIYPRATRRSNSRAVIPLLRAAIGVHPHESKDLDEATLRALRALAAAPEVVALGEIGLDYYYDHSPRDVQREAFRRQLRWRPRSVADRHP